MSVAKPPHLHWYSKSDTALLLPNDLQTNEAVCQGETGAEAATPIDLASISAKKGVIDNKSIQINL